MKPDETEPLAEPLVQEPFVSYLEGTNEPTLQSSTKTMRNLRLILVQDISFKQHIHEVSKTGFSHFHNITKIRSILSQTRSL